MSTVTIDKKRIVHVMAISFLVGMLWLIAVRFFTYQPSDTHYHANFALFVDGERHQFERFTFYEEVASCSGADAFNPKIRTHMHEEISHVVHVHDEGATWGHFFANLGMTNGDTVFRTDEATFVEQDAVSIQFILNAEEVDTTANRTIQSEDSLLISINSQPGQDLEAQYAQITQDAGEYNEKDDPAACSGSASLSTGERLKRAIGIFSE